MDSITSKTETESRDEVAAWAQEIVALIDSGAPAAAIVAHAAQLNSRAAALLKF